MEPTDRQGMNEHRAKLPGYAKSGSSRPYDETSSEEGTVTKKIESVTSRVPSGVFLAFGLGAIAVSALLQVTGRQRTSNFVGEWVPTILILGLYNKLVKLHGSEG